jgi:hypothetical protein
MQKTQTTNVLSKRRSLTLKKESIRILEKQKLANVAGGGGPGASAANCDVSSAQDSRCSDRRLKKAIRRIPKALEIIASL